jgi:hypothetical protein
MTDHDKFAGETKYSMITNPVFIPSSFKQAKQSIPIMATQRAEVMVSAHYSMRRLSCKNVDANPV